MTRRDPAAKGATNDSVMALMGGGGGIDGPHSHRRTNSRGGTGREGYEMGKLESKIGTTQDLMAKR